LWWPRYSRGADAMIKTCLRGNESRLEEDMLAYLTAEGRFLGFDRGDWALLIAALAAVVLLTTLST
jgi:hypothetical protein